MTESRQESKKEKEQKRKENKVVRLVYQVESGNIQRRITRLPFHMAEMSVVRLPGRAYDMDEMRRRKGDQMNYLVDASEYDCYEKHTIS